jgi:hypothetical protein
MKITTKILVACLPGIVAGALFAASTGERAVSKPDEAAMSKVKATLDKLPLSFESNRGQTDSRVQYLSRGPGYNVFFTKEETVLSLKDTAASNAVVRMKLVGGTNAGIAHPSDPLSNTTNYLIGNDSSKWQTDVAQYTKLRYENVYPGIDVVYRGEQKQLRYDFIVKPGADPHAIQLAFQGADKISINKDGDLELTLNGKTLVTKKPYTYQEDGGAKKEVASHFVMKGGQVTFDIAKYDTNKELVIDPTVVFVSFLGGQLNDSVNGVAIFNPTQTIASLPSFYFVTGTTASPNFPVVGGPVQGAQAGVNEVFVTKISFNGATVIWSTYLGGNSQDTGNAIAVDGITGTGATSCAQLGCPVIVGQTFSANFPTVPFQGTGTAPAFPNLSGTNDAFAAKLASDGKSLIYSTFIGGVSNDVATGVALDFQANVFVGGYTDSPFFLCPGGVIPPTGVNQCTNANHTGTTTSSDAFVVKIPVAYPTGGFGALNSVLYGGFGEEFARGIAYNGTNNMVYLGGDTTTTTQNFINPNNVGLPGITNQTAVTQLPGPGPQARGGFVVAFDATSFVRTFASYVAVSPNGSVGTETITGIAAEGGAKATNCKTTTLTCDATSTATATIAATYGNVGHIYITGNTTSKVPTGNIAVVVPSFGCINPLAAASTVAGGPIVGPTGLPILVPGGVTIPTGCTTALITQSPFNMNAAVSTGCPYPLVLPSPPNPMVPTATCNLSAYAAILDGALLTAPVPGATLPNIGNQIEYWAYYSGSNSSTISNAIAIDTNPITLTSVYSLGTYQQMYITGATTLTSAAGTNNLPMTNTVSITGGNFSEIFTTYNVGTTSGGGTGAWNPFDNPPVPVQFTTNGYMARFNANGLAASSFGGQGALAANLPAGDPSFPNMGYGSNEVTPPTQPNDHSMLIHTPQFNFGEYFYSTAGTIDGSSIPNTIGNAIAVDPTRAVLLGGSTNNKNAVTPTSATGACTTTATGIIPCTFDTTNNLGSQPVPGQNNGGTDGWVSVLFFNDILTDASSVATANPFLQPGFLQDTVGLSYIQTTPAPFGPTFDFAISDLATQTQTFRVLFTGQTSGQLLGQTPFFVPLDPRAGASQPTVANGLPGSGIAYYVPCVNPEQSAGPVLGANPSAGYYNNAYPAPGTPYGPQTCAFPDPSHLYEKLPILYSGWPGLSNSDMGIAAGIPNPPTAKGYVTPGWLLVEQDINPGVVRLQLDRRAAAGLLEGTYVAQFLVTTYDSQHYPGQGANQWPPCGPKSQLNPFITPGAGNCTNPLTPLPADNHSILVTVRLIVRPTLFLSRNSGILTGVTSNLGNNPLSGPGVPGAPPTGNITIQQGTSPVPDWFYTGTKNETSAWPTAGGAPSFGLGTIINAGTNSVNSGPPVCSPFIATPGDNNVPGTTWPSQLQPIATGIPGGVTVPCPVSTGFAPNVWGTAVNQLGYGAAAYAGNGPGDFSGGPVVYSPAYPANLTAVPVGSTPVMTFLYDAGTVFNVTTGPLSNCSSNTPCNLSVEQNLTPSRPDAPGGLAAGGWNAEWQGGQDPVTQRNDATVHDYYVSAEGQATISVAAVNCTNWNMAQGHVAANGNWLGVQIGTGGNFVPICTDLTASTIGTQRAPATGCPEGGAGNCTHTTADAIIGDDTALPGAVGGQQIPLNFKTFAFSNRPALNGIPTTPSLYTADVYVWATRAKNSVPGYCLGASMPASSTTTGADPVPLCATSPAIASSSNPHPEVIVTLQQTFKVSLFVFDTTQVIQITPNTCPASGIAATFTAFATVANSENLFTGNITPPFGPGSIPDYPNFGQNASQLVEWSLLPFQTTGTNITGCFGPGGTTSTIPFAPCPNPFAPNAQGGNASGGNNINSPIPLPTGVSVDPQSLQDYNACRLPTGKFNGTAINGSSVPGIGSITQTGPISQTQFVPSSNGSNNGVTIYACRPTVAPAWLNSPLYPGNAITAPGSPEQYANGNGPFGGPNAGAVNGCIATGSFPCAGGQGPVPSISGLTCGLSGSSVPPPVSTTKIGVFRGGNATLEDSNGSNAYEAGSDRFVANFFVAGNPGAPAVPTDIVVAGDWLGTGHASVGIYRPTTGQWFLDTNNNGIYDAGDVAPFNYGGIAGDKPVVGDWSGLGRTCVGIFRQGFFWVLDANCNNTFDAADYTFPFGGLGFGTAQADVPVVGSWTGNGKTRVGIVRACMPPMCTPASNPFLWVFDSADPSAGSSAAAHQPAAGAFAFGGLTGDVYVTGDWTGTGTTRAGIYRSGNWLEDLTGAHTYDTFFQFGGVPTDVPITGKW